MCRLSTLVLLVLVGGCAFRSDLVPVPDTIEPYYNLYSRNFVVAAPTAAANGICGTVGGLALGLAVGNEGGFYIGGVISANTCGALVGLPFIPLSYLCEENPWTIAGGQVKTPWSCGDTVVSSKLEGQ